MSSLGGCSNGRSKHPHYSGCDAVSFAERLIHELFDPVKQAEHALALHEYERTRTDPWVLYCRQCGDIGQYESPEEREIAASEHLSLERHQRDQNIPRESYGCLLHIWSY